MHARRVLAAAVLLANAAFAAPNPYAVGEKLTTPRLFAEGVVSTEDDEVGGVLSPDGREFWFVKRTPATIQSSLAVLCVSRFEGGRWGTPRAAPFSGRWVDYGPAFSSDGKRLYFSSTRPFEGAKGPEPRLWFVEKDGAAWSEPRFLPGPVNSSFAQTPSLAADGTLYFAGIRKDGKGSADIYRSRAVNGAFAEPENLGDAINTENPETTPFIAPDQSYLLFASVGRPDAPVGPGSPYPRHDLYVSFQRGGTWTPARRLPAPVNTDTTETSPFVSPDGRYLFFSSERNFTSIPMGRRLTHAALVKLLHAPRNGRGDIYQIDLDAAGLEEGKK
jgi:Tol biopolymer transport system component